MNVAQRLSSVGNSGLTYLGYVQGASSDTSAITLSLTGLGLKQGDLLIATGSRKPVSSSGWTSLGGQGVLTGTTWYAKASADYMVCGVTPPTSVSTDPMNFGNPPYDSGALIVLAFRGAHPTNPIIPGIDWFEDSIDTQNLALGDYNVDYGGSIAVVCAATGSTGFNVTTPELTTKQVLRGGQTGYTTETVALTGFTDVLPAGTNTMTTWSGGTSRDSTARILVVRPE